MKTIVLTRNIFDTIISIKDHLRKSSTIAPMAYIPTSLLNLDESDLEFALAELLSPWFFNFYVSWSNYHSKLHVTYEEMVENKEDFFGKILNYCGYNSKEIFNKGDFFILKNKKDRFNKGLVGRGEQLDSRAKDYILKISRYYPDTDLSLMGL